MRSGRTHTIRTKLVLLVIACVLPASLMAVMLVTYDYQRERTRLVRDSIATARALTSAMDRELAGLQDRTSGTAVPPTVGSA